MHSKLTRVTFTGADDTVDPRQLIAISEHSPIVEWGILIGSQHGHRFPSYHWIGTLQTLANPQVNLALHICGRHLRDIAAGRSIAALPKMQRFQRCQLNWHGEPQGEISSNIYRAFKEMEGYWTPEVIFQLDGANNGLPVHCASMKKTAGLFDLSHGAGVLPEVWPKNDVSDDEDFKQDTGLARFPIGYAGGLGPENLREQLPKIHAAARGDYWIDMETKLFEGLQFDMAKCREVLKIVEEFSQS